MGINAFSMGMCSAKCLTHLNNDARYSDHGFQRTTDDVTWPQKVNVMTAKSQKHHILTTVQSRWLFQIDHIEETVYPMVR